MRLAPASHALLQEFFRSHLADQSFRLPPIEFHAGVVSGLLTRVLMIGGLTMGRHVLLSPRLLGRDRLGRLRAQGWLVAHEAMHVLQYRREGLAPFLSLYLRQYFAGLGAGRMGLRARHRAAYLAIPLEEEAMGAQEAYREWRARAGAGAGRSC